LEGDCFYRRLVPAPVTPPDSPQPDRHSIPIALGPAQFNEFYRQCPPQVFPTPRIFLGAGTADRMLFIIDSYPTGSVNAQAVSARRGGREATTKPHALCYSVAEPA
jgi:hypothetical protein